MNIGLIPTYTNPSPKRRSPKRKSPKRKSPKRRSPKRKSPKRKSPKRKSPKRKSPKRRSPKRKSPKRKSPKRRSPKRKSPKRKSPKRKSSFKSPRDIKSVEWYIFTINTCVYCNKAKKLLEDHNKSFISTEINDQNSKDIYNSIDALTDNYRYFPIIFHNGKFIGGYTELNKLI